MIIKVSVQDIINHCDFRKRILAMNDEKDKHTYCDNIYVYNKEQKFFEDIYTIANTLMDSQYPYISLSEDEYLRLIKY